MIDIKCRVSQLQAFVAVSDEGSFSAAARLLDKGQPAISTSVSNLESALDLKLFDRSERLPILTSGGQALLPEARKFLYQALQVQQAAESWNSSLTCQQLDLVVDVICPLDKTVGLIDQLYSRFPGLSLTIHTEARGAVTARILDDSCEMGITGLLVPNAPRGLVTDPIGAVEFVAVATPEHEYLAQGSEVSIDSLREHNQLVLSDPSGLSTDHQVGVVGAKHWVVGNQSTKLQFLLKGYGWGLMPLHEVEQELMEGSLSSFKPAYWESPKLRIPLYIIHRAERPLSEVARYTVEYTKDML